MNKEELHLHTGGIVICEAAQEQEEEVACCGCSSGLEAERVLRHGRRRAPFLYSLQKQSNPPINWKPRVSWPLLLLTRGNPSRRQRRTAPSSQPTHHGRGGNEKIAMQSSTTGYFGFIKLSLYKIMHFGI